MKFIHKLADVQSDKIGQDTRIWQFSVVLKDASIGTNCNICANPFIENDVMIGNNVTVKCGVYIWDGVTIDDNVQLGPNVTFMIDKFPRAKKSFQLCRTIIKKNASIGAGAVIICGISVGESAMIGASAVVTKDVQAYTSWYGNPAKQTGYVTKEGIVLDLNLKDKSGIQYQLKNTEPVK